MAVTLPARQAGPALAACRCAIRRAAPGRCVLPARRCVPADHGLLHHQRRAAEHRCIAACLGVRAGVGDRRVRRRVRGPAGPRRPARRPLRSPPIFLGALIGFVVASAVCGFAPTVGVLIAARIVQGATAALLIPQVLATFHHTLNTSARRVRWPCTARPPASPPWWGNWWAVCWSAPTSPGTSWRPIFLVNVPIGLVVLLVAARIVPKTRSDHPVGIDLPGTVLFAATLTALLVPLTEGHSLGWPWWTWAMIALAVVLGAVTFVVEQRAERRGEIPLLPPSLLRLPSMSRGLVMVFAFSIGFGAFMFVFALTVQDGLHADALHGGLAILPMAVLFFLGSVFAPRLIGRFGRAALSVGAVIQLAGLASLVVVVVQGWPHVGLWAMAVPLALAGAGQSMLFAGLFRSVLADVPTYLGGVGSGVLITLQQSGLALGVATLGTLYLARRRTTPPTPSPPSSTCRWPSSPCSPSAPPRCRASPRPPREHRRSKPEPDTGATMIMNREYSSHYPGTLAGGGNAAKDPAR